jgi:hypothetical protein
VSQKSLEALRQAFATGEWSAHESDHIEEIKEELPPEANAFFLEVAQTAREADWLFAAIDLVPYLIHDAAFETHKKVWLGIVSEQALNGKTTAVRRASAVALGKLVNWPNETLKKVILYETNDSVKMSAFRAILESLKLPADVIHKEVKRVANGEIQADFDEINRITQARADRQYD